MIAKKWFISTGNGCSKTNRLPSFDKALLDAKVGNYNLVRLSSILPAGCERVDHIDIDEGSLLPTAYSTITSDVPGDICVSTIGVGIPKDKSKVGVIMEYSCSGACVCEDAAMETLTKMIEEAFDIRNVELEEIVSASTSIKVTDGCVCTSFACIAEW